jgi:predicted MFS family arabinose efflux permease
VLWLIHRIGNTASSRISALLLLLSSVSITFGGSYLWIAAGRVMHGVSLMFHSVTYVALENNLELMGRSEDYLKVRTAANTVYSVITMVISFVASPMFNWNHYLPMYGCITTCAIGFVLSFFMVDHSKYNKIRHKKAEKKQKLPLGKLILLTILVFGLFYPIVQNGQSDGKLFIQQHLLLDFSLDDTSLIIGVILCVSRIVRVISNLLFPRFYRRYKEKMSVILPSFLCSSIALMLFGSMIPWVSLKILVMAIGYVIILFIRDPFRLVIQDVVLNRTDREHHQTLLTIMEFAVKIGTAATSFCFTLVLLEHTMMEVMSITLIIVIIEVLLSIRLYRMLTAKPVKTI